MKAYEFTGDINKVVKYSSINGYHQMHSSNLIGDNNDLLWDSWIHRSRLEWGATEDNRRIPFSNTYSKPSETE